MAELMQITAYALFAGFAAAFVAQLLLRKKALATAVVIAALITGYVFVRSQHAALLAPSDYLMLATVAGIGALFGSGLAMLFYAPAKTENERGAQFLTRLLRRKTD